MAKEQTETPPISLTENASTPVCTVVIVPSSACSGYERIFGDRTPRFPLRPGDPTVYRWTHLPTGATGEHTFTDVHLGLVRKTHASITTLAEAVAVWNSDAPDLWRYEVLP